jgi:hypothetical protein
MWEVNDYNGRNKLPAVVTRLFEEARLLAWSCPSTNNIEEL